MNGVSQAPRRIWAIVHADFLIRFRRTSTVVLLLILGASAYLWIPDPASGRALLEIGGRRVLLSSAAIGMATASLGSILLGLIGFYVVSSALRRDVETRCGAVIAATPMRSLEYLVGKTLGNLVFLAAFTTAFMLFSMAMVLVRGEGPLEPLVFLRQYLLLVPGTIVMASVMAVLFESIPLLAGRLGDVLYFFIWLGLLVPGVALLAKHPSSTPSLLAYFDPSAFVYLLAQMRTITGTTAIAIGAMPFNPSLAPVAFHGLTLHASWVLARLSSIFSPFLLLAVALVFFHRFDPARAGVLVARTREGFLRRLERWVKPLSRPLVAAVGAARRDGRVNLLGAARSDAAVTLASFPLAAIALPVFILLALSMRTEAVVHGLTEVLVAVVAVVIADVPCRESRYGTRDLVFAAPLLESRFVAWKSLSALVVAGLFMIVPLARAAFAAPSALLPMLVGLAFLVATATTLGILSSNPKTFIVFFLSFWYLAVNDKGHTPYLDFAGFTGASTPRVVLTYAVLAIFFYVLAETSYRLRRRREAF